MAKEAQTRIKINKKPEEIGWQFGPDNNGSAKGESVTGESHPEQPATTSSCEGVK